MYPAAELSEPGKVQSVQVYRTLDLSGLAAIVISWNEHVPGVTEVDSFSVYRSMGGDFSLLVSGLTTTSYFDNSDIQHGSTYSYKVVYYKDGSGSDTDDATSANIYSLAPVGLSSQRLYWVGMETLRRTQWILNNFGENVIIFIKKRFGTACSECYDTIQDGSNDPRCSICYGTGYVGGYHRYSGRMLYSPTTSTIIEGDAGRQMSMTPRTYLSSFPVVHSEDIVIRQDGERYMIGDTQGYIQQNFLMLQEITTAKVERGHPAWRLE